MGKKRLARDLDLFDCDDVPTIVVPHQRRYPSIPRQVPCVSMWRTWGSLVAAGLKPIESRSWTHHVEDWAPPPAGPSFWLALHATHRDDAKLDGAIRPLPDVKHVPAGVVFAVALVTGIRPLVPEDGPKAHVYREGLYAWELELVRVLDPMLELGRGFQKMGHVDGRVLRNSRPNDRPGMTWDTVSAWDETVRNDWLTSGDRWPIRSYSEALEAIGSMR